jgi:hypothetical protein
MNRLFLLLALAVAPQWCVAAVYKCVQADGRVQYQATPCQQGSQAAIRPSGASTTMPASTAARPGDNAPVAKRQCVDKEIRISFPNMPVKSTLQVIAEYAGHTLVLDPAISGSGSGAFQYDCVPWPVILQDIAKNHGLTIRVESRSIVATKR